MPHLETEMEGLTLEDASPLENGQAEETGAAEGDSSGVCVEQEAVKKKKKKKKSKGKTKPSGFEEFSTDAPLTVEQAQALKELYNPSKPFHERIEICIQRYRQKRKWNELRQKIFDAYLALGGIKTGQKQFQGFDPKNVDAMDAEEIGQMTAQNYVALENEDEWVVTFSDVVRAFLSYRLPYVLCIQKPEELEQGAQILRNFLNYVLLHEVAPEYTEDILKARGICDVAERELVLCKEMSNRFPGDFNIASSTLFDGYYAGLDLGDAPSDWCDATLGTAGMSVEKATKVFVAGVKQRGTEKQQATVEVAKIARRRYMLLEVVDITLPQNAPSLAQKGEEEYFTGLQTLGTLKVRSWAPEVNGEAEIIPDYESIPFELWLEKEHLQYCFKGMKIEGRVHELDNGVKFIDSITGVMCSFYNIIDEEDSDDDVDD